MKKQIKIVLTLVLAVILVAALAVPAFALPINSDILDNYFYDKDMNASEGPLAYRTVSVLGGKDLNIGIDFNPVDMCVAGEYLYIVDKAATSSGNRIIVLDSEFNLVTILSKLVDTETYSVPELDAKNYASGKDEEGNYPEDTKLKKADKYSFNNPQGIYVDEDNNIYIADTDNRRVVVCDIDGNCKKVIQSVKVSVLGDYNFRPIKLFVDNTGFINVIAYDVNKGLMRIDEDGTFDSFFAQPSVKDNGEDLIAQWADELAGLTDNEIKEAAYSYVSATRDSKGFIYVTAYQSADNAATPLQKLNSAGTNVLKTTDNVDTEMTFGDPMGLGETEYVKMIDVAVNEAADTYTLLDVTSGRFFTYSSGGAQLYVGGGQGTQYGRLTSPSCIECWGNYIIVGDTTTDCITVYELTDYAKKLNTAMALYKTRDYEASAENWLEVAKYNSNMYLAFDSLGNVALIQGRDLSDSDPAKVQYMKSALNYYTIAGSPSGYSDAYAELRDVQMSKYFNLLFGTVIVVGVGLFVMVQVRKALRNKEARKRRLGL